MLDFAGGLRACPAGLGVLNLGGALVDTSTPVESMVFTVMSALAQMELDIGPERITRADAKRRAAGGDLDGRPLRVPDGRSATLFD
jgi:DNA invertase Pin-like site-specific DNA recombinase